MRLYFIFILLIFLPNSISKFSIFSPSPKDIDAIHSRRATLQCGINTKYYKEEDFKIHWTLNGVKVVPDVRRKVVENNLVFKEVDLKLDNGNFVCVAVNKTTGKPYNSKPAQLNIKWVDHNGIVVIIPDAKYKIYPKSSLKLFCNITGKPEPHKIKWSWQLKNGSEIVVDERSKIMNISEVTMKLNDSIVSCCVDSMKMGTCNLPKNKFLIRVRDPKLPYIYDITKDLVVKKKSKMWLHCYAWAVDDYDVEFQWIASSRSSEYLKNKTRDNIPRQTIFPNGTLYRYKQPRSESFRCHAKNLCKDCGFYERQVNVDLATIEDFSKESDIKYIYDLPSIEHKCTTPAGKPTPTTKWYKDKVAISYDENERVKQTESGMILIEKASKADEGKYYCVATNIAGSKNFTLEVIQSVRPVVGKLSSQTVNEYSDVLFECNVVAGIPKPSVQWWVNGTILANEDNKIEIKNENLTIYKADTSNQGRYHCELNSSLFKSVTSNYGYLKVTESLKIFPPLKDRCLASNETSKIDCKISGLSNGTSKNKINVKWSRLKNRNKKTLQHDNFTTLKSANGLTSTLIFPNVSQSDTGLYKCIASDGKTNTDGTVRVTVVERPVIVEDNLNNMEIKLNDNVTLKCRASNLDLEVVWQFGQYEYKKSPVSKYRIHVSDDNSLHIRNFQSTDHGTYTCVYRVCDFQVNKSAELKLIKGIADDAEKEKDENTTFTIQTIALVISGLVAYIIITIGVILYCRKNKKNKKLSDAPIITSVNDDSRSDKLLQRSTDIQMKQIKRVNNEKLQKLYYPSENIQAVSVIGKGEMGSVFLSRAPGLFPQLDDDVLVMVKSMEENSDEAQQQFEDDIELLRKSQHENIVKLLAVSWDWDSHDKKPNLLVTEYLDWGILKLCLKASSEERISKFSKMQKMELCHQIACGMEHLKDLNILHKDISCRNCVISSQLQVKISKLSLSRDGFLQDYYRELDGRVIPLRWLSPEALYTNSYSFKSEVWSFGVTCWEIFMLGKFPYEGVEDEQLIRSLNDDSFGTSVRLSTVKSSRRINSLINKCCQILPSNRPDIKPIKKKLYSIISQKIHDEGDEKNTSDYDD